MKPDGFLSLRDYFNYYISGLLWCLSFIFFWSTFFNWIDLISPEIHLSDPVGAIVAGVLIIIVPYVVGFIMLPLGERARVFWQGGRGEEDRTWFPDPKQHILKYKKKPDDVMFKGRRIPFVETTQLINSVKDKLGYKYPSLKSFHLYFYPVRAYVLEYGGKSATLIDRARDLANFTESLLLPAPLSVLGFGLFVFSRITIQYWGSLFGVFIIIKSAVLLLPLSLGSAMGLHYLLVKRYFQLEEYWVKHVYRAFLAITRKKKG